jgi:hypothetical protein
MAEEKRQPEDQDDYDDDAVSTPFEKPFFMPVLLLGLALWFGYDGWFNEEMEWIQFNRWVFGGLMILVVYTTWQDVREVRRTRESDDS